MHTRPHIKHQSFFWTPPFQCHEQHKHSLASEVNLPEGIVWLLHKWLIKRVVSAMDSIPLPFAKSWTCWSFFFLFSPHSNVWGATALAKLMTQCIALATAEEKNKTLSGHLLPVSYRRVLLLLSRLQKAKFFLQAASHENTQQELKIIDSAEDCSVWTPFFFF